MESRLTLCSGKGKSDVDITPRVVDSRKDNEKDWPENGIEA